MQPLTVDFHLDVPWRMYKNGGFDLTQSHPETAVDFPRMRTGGLDAAFMALYLSDEVQTYLGPEQVEKTINWQYDMLKIQSQSRVVSNAVEAFIAANEGLIPMFLGLEGGRLINGSLDRLQALRAIGVRYLTLTHNKSHDWCDSATDVPRCNGLGSFGVTVVKKAEDMGIFIDVSHVSDNAASDVLFLSEAPVPATHSGVRGLVNHPRNLTDSLIKQIAASGGMIGVPFAARFVGHTAEAMMDHIDWIVQLTGSSKHVGIGSDLDGAPMIQDCKSAAEWRSALDLESYLGYKSEDVENILGGNIMRLMS